MCTFHLIEFKVITWQRFCRERCEVIDDVETWLCVVKGIKLATRRVTVEHVDNSNFP